MDNKGDHTEQNLMEQVEHRNDSPVTIDKQEEIQEMDLKDSGMGTDSYDVTNQDRTVTPTNFYTNILSRPHLSSTSYQHSPEEVKEQSEMNITDLNESEANTGMPIWFEILMKQMNKMEQKLEKNSERSEELMNRRFEENSEQIRILNNNNLEQLKQLNELKQVSERLESKMEENMDKFTKELDGLKDRILSQETKCQANMDTVKEELKKIKEHGETAEARAAQAIVNSEKKIMTAMENKLTRQLECMVNTQEVLAESKNDAETNNITALPAVVSENITNKNEEDIEGNKWDDGIKVDSEESHTIENINITNNTDEGMCNVNKLNNNYNYGNTISLESEHENKEKTNENEEQPSIVRHTKYKLGAGGRYAPKGKMDNPCFDDDSRKTVYTIERLPEVPGKTHSHNPQLRKSKVATLAAALFLGTIIVLITTAALVYTLRTVHTNYRTNPTATSTWAAEMIVSGEFRITNEPFRSSLYNLSSPDFKQLSKRIEKELATLYGNSALWQEVQGVAVTSLSPGLQVRCSLTLQPKDSLTIGKVGLAFLAGLNHSHGHLWLGPFSVDVLSIGFQARTEEVSWSQWSDWSDCQLSGEGELVRRRRRVCLSLDGLKLSRSEPCQAISKPLTNDTESEPCLTKPTTPQPSRAPPPVGTMASVTELTKASMTNFTTAPTTPQTTTTTTTIQTTSLPSNITTTKSSTMVYPTIRSTEAPKSSEQSTTTRTTTLYPDKGSCSSCAVNEVCVALEGDPIPVCRPMIDQADPTGCGGLCQINTEVCHRLGQGAYRCVDDSKCLDNEWQCGNTLCIPFIKRCDGHFNCYDHTDEHNCDCDLKTHFQCGKNLSCLPQSKRCDGIVDCWDAADESNCTIACLDETQFTCNDSQCIPSKNFCDGFVDCNDHSDEPFGCGGVCKNHEWRCSNGRCIVKRDVCNGLDDCGDNSDEIKCGKRRGARI